MSTTSTWSAFVHMHAEVQRGSTSHAPSKRQVKIRSGKIRWTPNTGGGGGTSRRAAENITAMVHFKPGVSTCWTQEQYDVWNAKRGR
jgi:hypothetical protein